MDRTPFEIFAFACVDVVFLLVPALVEGFRKDAHARLRFVLVVFDTSGVSVGESDAACRKVADIEDYKRPAVHVTAYLQSGAIDMIRVSGSTLSLLVAYTASNTNV